MLLEKNIFFSCVRFLFSNKSQKLRFFSSKKAAPDPQHLAQKKLSM